MKAAIVIPSNRADSIKTCLSAWEKEFSGHEVIVVEDGPKKTFDLKPSVRHVSWEEVDTDLGVDGWIIPRRTDAVRNYGFLLAGRSNPDMIVSLDDDCLPAELNFLLRHWQALEAPARIDQPFNTVKGIWPDWDTIKARGFPRQVREREAVLNHGLWNGIPDFDGETQLLWPHLRASFPNESRVVPRGSLFPMCGMNVAFRPMLLPAMYFPPMGEGQPYHRFGDIWCGLVAKRVCDSFGWPVRSGAPCVQHERASDASRNAALEKPGIEENERLWSVVADAPISHGRIGDAVRDVYAAMDDGSEYWKSTGQAIIAWCRLIEAAL